MAETLKVLGQAAPAATTWGNVYTPGTGKSAIVGTLNVCNRGAATTIRIAVRPAGAALANAHYQAYDVPIPANDTIPLSIGITLAATDALDGYSASGNVSFSAFGSEVS